MRSPVQNTTDNLPYAFHERLADGTVRDITGELPFEVPDSWEWVRLGNVIAISGGGTPDKANPSYWNGKIPWASVKDMKGDELLKTIDYITKEGLESKQSISLCEQGDLIVATRLVPGKSLVCRIRSSINQDLKRIQTSLEIKYLHYWFTSSVSYFMKLGQGTTVPGIKLEDLENALFSLPPLNEQYRIVTRIEQLLPHIANYDAAEQKLAALNASFPGQLKKSILQAAVQGKLAPQDATDEPASALLERIRTEREALIKSGRAKRDKRESSIFRRDNSYYEKIGGAERCIDDELPFDLPETWE